MSTSMVSSNQPQHNEAVLRILSATESPTCLFLAGTSNCLVNVPLTILILHDQCLYGMFVTGMFTAAAFQLFSTNVERLRLT